MKNLRENGYISMDPDGFIKLEQPGMEIAQRIYGRHRKLTAFLWHWALTRMLPPKTPARSSTT